MGDHVASNGAEIFTPCARCGATNASLVVRSERLCKDCFAKYVISKIVKRLETNKLRGRYHDAQKSLLIPVSFDVSSICLLHALDQQLRKRVESGHHAGYTLHVLCIDESSVREGPDVQTLLPLLKDMFPGYVYSVHSLEDCLAYGVDLESLIPKPGGVGSHEQSNGSIPLVDLISSLPSATSRVDVVDILRRRLTAAIAKRNSCDSILYSDSTTKLAERILAETVKGRGGALPWLTSDNVVMDGIPYSYPLRDLLQKELVLYVNVLFPSLKQLIVSSETEKSVVSSKDMTIDGLINQYFESVEEGFPSIVANVVRTTGKLAVRSELGGGKVCDLCTLPVCDLDQAGQGGDAVPFSRLQIDEARDPQQLCSGCARALYPP